MVKAEASWVGEALGGLPLGGGSKVLNVGSSTLDYRVRQQPHLEALVFGPLAARGAEIVHQDIKAAPGVDFVGDLTRTEVLEKLSQTGWSLVLCNNLLEHLKDRGPLLAALRQLVAPGGHLVVTGPRSFYRHLDPIDTLFRPSTGELAALFPGMVLVKEATVEAGTVWDSMGRRPGELARLLLRVALPFWRPRGWITAAHRLAWLFRTRSVSCVLLRKAEA